MENKLEELIASAMGAFSGITVREAVYRAYDLGRASAAISEEVREVLMDVKLYMSSCMCACEHDYECLRCRLPRRIDALLEGRKG